MPPTGHRWKGALRLYPFVGVHALTGVRWPSTLYAFSKTTTYQPFPSFNTPSLLTLPNLGTVRTKLMVPFIKRLPSHPSFPILTPPNFVYHFFGPQFPLCPISYIFFHLSLILKVSHQQNPLHPQTLLWMYFLTFLLWGKPASPLRFLFPLKLSFSSLLLTVHLLSSIKTSDFESHAITYYPPFTPTVADIYCPRSLTLTH